MTRGALARKRAKQMRAIYMIMLRFKRYKMRSYILSIVDRFRGVARTRDYGKSVQWPRPPAVLQGLVSMLQKVHMRWVLLGGVFVSLSLRVCILCMDLKSVQWPRPPAVLQGLVSILQKVHVRWGRGGGLCLCLCVDLKSLQWSRPPAMLQGLVSMLQKVHVRWVVAALPG